MQQTAAPAVLGYQPGPQAPVVPLKLTMELCALPEDVLANLRTSMARPYGPKNRRINEMLGTETGPFSVVGFGPSLKDTWQDLQGIVMACNGALAFLLERGIVPKYAMFFDADPIMERFVVPHPDVTYLVASRCHPSIFEKLRDCNVVTWHVLCGEGGEPIDELLTEHNKAEPMICGGTAAVTRGMHLADCLMQQISGREIHLFGVDSSFEGEFTHAKKSIVPEREIQLWCEGRWFRTTPWLCGQAEDFKILAPVLRDGGVRLVVHGTGLVPHIARAWGYEAPDESDHPLEPAVFLTKQSNHLETTPIT